MSQIKENSVLHVAFYPWFALGHLTSFLRLANKLAERGHRVSYFIPSKTLPKLAPHNHFPSHLTLIPITVPSVEGLPPGAETTNDAPSSCAPLIMTAMDMTRDTIEAHLARLKPSVVFYDFTYWMPELGRKLGFKSVHYITAFISRYAYLAHYKKEGRQPTATDLLRPPPGFPSTIIRMQPHEAELMAAVGNTPFGLGGLTLAGRLGASYLECDAFGVKTCNEMEGPYCEFMAKIYGKPVLVAGPMVPKPPSSVLDEHIDGWLKGFGASSLIYCALGSECVLEKDQFQEIVLGLELTGPAVPEPPSSKLDDFFDGWLSGFDHGKVVFCAFGSECVLQKNQFQELVLGLELTGRPFLAALRPPRGCETIEEALPTGYLERIKGRGIIHGGWVQQQLILHHPSIGCFVTHCGTGSLSEAMSSECQLVLIPQAGDQFLNARLMSMDLKVGIEVEKGEDDGFFTKEAVFKAIEEVMNEGSTLGKEMRANHTKWRNVLLTEGLEESYIDEFIQRLQDML